LTPLACTDEQKLLEDNLRRLLSDVNDFESRRRRLSATPADRMALWPHLAEIGIIGAAFPEMHGGYAGDPRTLAIVMLELGRTLAVEPYLATAVIVGRVLQRMTDASARNAAIEPIINGARVIVLAHDAGDDPYGPPSISAETADDSITLSGAVRCVRHADVADEFLLSVRIGESTRLVQLPRGTDGLELDTYRLIDGAGGGDLRLSEVQLAASECLTLDDPTEDVLRDAIEWGLLGLVAETAGIITALNSATFAYLATRKQFGTVIGRFQALQHRAADMYVAAEETFAMLRSAIDGMTHPSVSARSAILSAAKVVADRGGHCVGHEAIQLHGGMGVSDELIVSHYARRLACIRSELGAADAHRLRFAGLQ
jgi:alkylation response protein AidB-like acyl-CoA dehydrogenase